jgi:hypothetical protein
MQEAGKSALPDREMKRLAATWLLIVGFLWLLIAGWVMQVMRGMATHTVASWLLVIMYYAGPLALILGAGLVLARRWRRVGVLLAFFACGWLTWLVGSEVWPRQPGSDTMGSLEFSWLSVALVFVVLLSDIAITMMLRRGTE